MVTNELRAHRQTYLSVRMPDLLDLLDPIEMDQEIQVKNKTEEQTPGDQTPYRGEQTPFRPVGFNAE